jgi:hypothetical protein
MTNLSDNEFNLAILDYYLKNNAKKSQQYMHYFMHRAAKHKKRLLELLDYIRHSIRRSINEGAYDQVDSIYTFEFDSITANTEINRFRISMIVAMLNRLFRNHVSFDITINAKRDPASVFYIIARTDNVENILECLDNVSVRSRYLAKIRND